jgi:hypothetical protein
MVLVRASGELPQSKLCIDDVRMLFSAPMYVICCACKSPGNLLPLGNHCLSFPFQYTIRESNGSNPNHSSNYQVLHSCCPGQTAQRRNCCLLAGGGRSSSWTILGEPCDDVVPSPGLRSRVFWHNIVNIVCPNGQPYRLHAQPGDFALFHDLVVTIILVLYTQHITSVGALNISHKSSIHGSDRGSLHDARSGTIRRQRVRDKLLTYATTA